MTHHRCLSLFLTVILAGCGSSKEQPGGSGGAAAATGGAGDQSTADATSSSTGAGGGGDSVHEQAAIDTATKSDVCKAIAPFYWEIGDVKSALVSGSTGDGSFTASTSMKIASASKLMFGAYVVERFKDDLGQIDVDAMTMRSGYTGFTDCGNTKTVAGCLALGTNGVLHPEEVGRFYYGGGHYQNYGVDLGLGLDGNTKLATDIGDVIGPELGLAYWIPEPAAGVELTPEKYAVFLRKILAGDLAIASHLGEGAVCTLQASCPAADSSPVPEAWHYSYGHWVEDDPTTGDGSFSSPGLFGFYPWIGASKKIYGLVARFDPADALKPPLASSYWMSVVCGRAIRAAFQTGKGP